MKIFGALGLAATVAAFVACNAATADLGGGPSPNLPQNDGGDAGENVRDDGGSVVEVEAGGDVDAGCGAPLDGVIVAPGGTLTPRPTESSIRVRFLYQGTELAITHVLGADVVIPGAGTPLQAGVNSGYWYELQDAAGAALYTRTFYDPTIIEAPGPDGGFKNATAPLCSPKTINAEVPNPANGKAIVVYGSPYGTQDVAQEIARFHLP